MTTSKNVNQIVEGRIVNPQMANQIAKFMEIAKRHREKADAEKQQVKDLLAPHGIKAMVIVTERMALLYEAAQMAETNALSLLEECPQQTISDESWSG